jgi:valyl-tRNA synthetase
MIKPAYGQPIDRKTYEATLMFFERLLKLLHPFMPFITEELWQNLYDRKDGESIMVSTPNQTGETLTRENRVESISRVSRDYLI